MNDPGLMGICQRLANIQESSQQVIQASLNRLAGLRLSMVLYFFRECFTLEIFHHIERQAVTIFPHFIDRDDAWMRKLSGDLGLVQEAGSAVAGCRFRDDLLDHHQSL